MSTGCDFVILKGRPGYFLVGGLHNIAASRARVSYQLDYNLHRPIFESFHWHGVFVQQPRVDHLAPDLPLQRWAHLWEDRP